MSSTAGYIVNRQDSGQELGRHLERFSDNPVARKKHLKRILKCSVFLNASLLIATLILVTIQHYIPKSDNEKQQKKLAVTLNLDNNSSVMLEQENKEMVCIACNYLGTDLKERDTLYDVITETECGERLCCIKNGKEIHAIIGEMIENSHSEGRNLGSAPDEKAMPDLKWWRGRKNAAHLFSNVTDGTVGKPVTWTSADNTSLTFTNGIKLVDNRLQVQMDGLYFVYAAFTFDYQGIDFVPVMYHNVTIQHPLLRKIGAMAHLMSKYGGSRDHDETRTSFLSGILHLQPGFQLATHVSSYDFLDRSRYSHYFGMFQI